MENDHRGVPPLRGWEGICSHSSVISLSSHRARSTREFETISKTNLNLHKPSGIVFIFWPSPATVVGASLSMPAINLNKPRPTQIRAEHGTSTRGCFEPLTYQPPFRE